MDIDSVVCVVDGRGSVGIGRVYLCYWWRGSVGIGSLCTRNWIILVLCVILIEEM